jgi:hypothetical protein
MKMGSIVDIILTNPDDYEKEFYEIKYDKPTATTLKLYEEVISRIERWDRDKIIKELYNIKYELDLWSNITNEKIIKNRVESPELLAVIKEHYDSQDKVTVYADEVKQSKALVETLRSHEFTSKYFTPKADTEIMFQTPIIFDRFKALLDGIVIDKWNKLIIPFDLKTSDESAFNFPSKIYRWRYDIQAAIYTEAAKAFRDTLYPDFQLNDFLFVVGSFSLPDKPMVYNAKGILDSGTNGIKLGTRFYKGYKQLVEDFQWHSENNLWDYKREVYANNGITDLYALE